MERNLYLQKQHSSTWSRLCWEPDYSLFLLHLNIRDYSSVSYLSSLIIFLIFQLGLILIVIICIVCLHCMRQVSYSLLFSFYYYSQVVHAAHFVCSRNGRDLIDYANIMRGAVELGPEWLRHKGYFFKLVTFNLFLIYLQCSH